MSEEKIHGTKRFKLENGRHIQRYVDWEGDVIMARDGFPTYTPPDHKVYRRLDLPPLILPTPHERACTLPSSYARMLTPFALIDRKSCPPTPAPIPEVKSVRNKHSDLSSVQLLIGPPPPLRRSSAPNLVAAADAVGDKDYSESSFQSSLRR